MGEKLYKETLLQLYADCSETETDSEIVCYVQDIIDELKTRIKLSKASPEQQQAYKYFLKWVEGD